MKNPANWIVIGFVFLGLAISNSCGPPQSTTVAQTPTEPTEISTPSTHETVAGILTSPTAYCGKEVTIVGTYQGWDWQGQVGTGPPVTRSDWVIADASGAIYVAARGEETSALGLDPTDRQKVIQLMVKGVVRMSQRGQPYIEPLDIKILEKEDLKK